MYDIALRYNARTDQFRVFNIAASDGLTTTVSVINHISAVCQRIRNHHLGEVEPDSI